MFVSFMDISPTRQLADTKSQLTDSKVNSLKTMVNLPNESHRLQQFRLWRFNFTVGKLTIVVGYFTVGDLTSWRLISNLTGWRRPANVCHDILLPLPDILKDLVNVTTVLMILMYENATCGIADLTPHD